MCQLYAVIIRDNYSYALLHLITPCMGADGHARRRGWWLVAPLTLCLELLHACAIAPIADVADQLLSHADEAAHALVRESFLVLARGVNGISTWALSVCFDGTARDRLRTTWDKEEHKWWQDTRSTFNEIVAICDTPGGRGRAGMMHWA